MMIVRPITAEDHDALWRIAQQTGAGFTSLQADRKMVADKLQWALKSRRKVSLDSINTPNALKKSLAENSANKENLYLFVMEDFDTHEVVGTTAIESAVGLSSPWYNYKVNKQVHTSKKFGVYNIVETLMLCNDHTGYSELCTLFLLPDARHSCNGALLSKSRFMFMAAFPQLFSESIIAEMRGYSDEKEVSPFWEALGRHFFSKDFAQADRHISTDKSVIAELMPRHPIYVNLLPESARDVIGATHTNTTPARRLLESEGLRYSNYVDIFDAGPLLESKIQSIRAVRDSRVYKVKVVDNPTTEERLWLLANDNFNNFRCTIGSVSFEGFEFVDISPRQAEALKVSNGERLRVVPLASNGEKARNKS